MAATAQSLSYNSAAAALPDSDNMMGMPDLPAGGVGHFDASAPQQVWNPRSARGLDHSDGSGSFVARQHQMGFPAAATAAANHQLVASRARFLNHGQAAHLAPEYGVQHDTAADVNPQYAMLLNSALHQYQSRSTGGSAQMSGVSATLPPPLTAVSSGALLSPYEEYQARMQLAAANAQAGSQQQKMHHSDAAASAGLIRHSFATGAGLPAPGFTLSPTARNRMLMSQLPEELPTGYPAAGVVDSGRGYLPTMAPRTRVDQNFWGAASPNNRNSDIMITGAAPQITTSLPSLGLPESGAGDIQCNFFPSGEEGPVTGDVRAAIEVPFPSSGPREVLKNNSASASPSSEGQASKIKAAKAKPKRKLSVRKSNADRFKPRRPLSAYNLFFSEERGRILKELEEKDGGNKDPSKGPSPDESKSSQAPPSEEKSEAAPALLRPMLPAYKKKRLHRKTHGKISFRELVLLVGERWKNLPSDRRMYYQNLAAEDMKRQKAAMLEYREQKRKMAAKQELQKTTVGGAGVGGIDDVVMEALSQVKANSNATAGV